MTDREEHSKWHALLQPIRDLEKNWDIDIAGELADYLEELSQITFEVDGICNLDFAEAALVVHSSSCTYGKKVEHLLKLTVSALENVRQKHERKNSGKRRKVRRACFILLQELPYRFKLNGSILTLAREIGSVCKLHYMLCSLTMTTTDNCWQVETSCAA